MLGGTVYRIVKWAIIAAVALLIGSQLLSSVYSIVLAFRLGNYVAFIGVIIVATTLTWLSGRDYDWKLADLLIDVIAGAALIVSVLSIFFALLSNGILVSIIGSSSYVGLLTIVRAPKLAERMRESRIAGSLQFMDWIPGTQNKDFLVQRMLQTLDISVLLLPTGSIQKILPILKERPFLPIAITRFLDTDVLFVRNSSSEQMNKILELLKAANVVSIDTHSPLFSSFILSLPMLDNSATLHDHVIVQNAAAMERLLSEESVRLTLYPSPNGPTIVVAKSDALGIDAVDIPQTHLSSVLLKRNIEHLLCSIEVERAAK